MSRAEIIKYYSANTHLTLKQLAAATGKSVEQVQFILMSEILV